MRITWQTHARESVAHLAEPPSIPHNKDFDDHMAGVDTVVGRGYVDSKNMYVFGCSGGGVLTSWTVGHTDRFAAAAALCPVADDRRTRSPYADPADRRALSGPQDARYADGDDPDEQRVSRDVEHTVEFLENPIVFAELVR